MKTAKDNALEALSTARKMVTSPEPLTDMQLFQLRGLLDFAEGETVKIQETKRPRKPKEDPT